VGPSGVLVHNDTCTELRKLIDASLAAVNPADREPGVVADFLDKNGYDVASFNRKIVDNGLTVGDIDVETNNAIIEVTIATQGKLEQATKLATNKVVNPLGKPVFLFSRGYSRFADKQFAAIGVTIVRSEPELLAKLKSLGGS
jgi:hypothetical protein